MGGNWQVMGEMGYCNLLMRLVLAELGNKGFGSRKGPCPKVVTIAQILGADPRALARVAALATSYAIGISRECTGYGAGEA
jgi:hypothetical protein